MRVTTETLSQVTNLLAIVSAPPVDTATIRHVEVLALQPQVADGRGHHLDRRRVRSASFTFGAPVDPGLVEWAAEYLNERLDRHGPRRAHAALAAERPVARARASARSSTQLAPAFTELAETAEDTLYVDGAARLLSEHRFQDLTQINELMQMLERRVALLGVLRAALAERDVLVRIGAENEAPALRSLALVAAGYGLPQRELGTVSLIGPVRMDYAGAIRTVREAAHAAVAIHRGRLRRGLTMATMPRDPYEVLGVPRDADETQIKKAFRKLARELHPDVNAHDPHAEEKFKEAAEAYEILSDAERRATYDRYGHEGLRSGGCAPNFDGFGSISDLFDAFFGGGVRRRSAAAAAGPTQGGDVAVSVDDHARRGGRRGTKVELELRGGRDAASTATATAPSRARRSSPASAAAATAQLQRRTRTPFGQVMRTVACDVCGGDGKRRRRAVRATATAAAARCARARCASTSRRASPTASASASTGRGHAGERGGAARRPLRPRPRRRGRALPARRRRPRHRARRPGAARRARRDASSVPTLDGDVEVEIPPARSRARCITLRGAGHAARCGGPAAAATCASSSTSSSRAG